jgi:hypothetical protein
MYPINFGQTLKMLRDDFIASDEWQSILRTLGEWKEHAVAAIRAAGDFATSRYYAGHLDAIDSFIDLPDKILSNGEPKEKAPEGVLDLPNHPRPSRNTYV